MCISKHINVHYCIIVPCDKMVIYLLIANSYTVQHKLWHKKTLADLQVQEN